MPVQIREATITDAGAIAQVHVTTWRAAYKGILPATYLESLSVDLHADRWRKSLARRWPRVLVADFDDAPVGWISFGPSRDADMDGSWGEVETLYVLPDFWGVGLGWRLMESARRMLSEAGRTDAALWVLSANERAKAFYSRAGFTAEGSSRGVRVARTLFTEVRYSCPLVGPWEAASVCMLGL